MDNVVEKSVYHKLVIKYKAIYTSGFTLKTQYNTDKLGLERKINDAKK